MPNGPIGPTGATGPTGPSGYIAPASGTPSVATGDPNSGSLASYFGSFVTDPATALADYSNQYFPAAALGKSNWFAENQMLVLGGAVALIVVALASRR